MNLLVADNLTKSYSERKLFNNASFSVEEGEKVGIIGTNGTGKSTLLKMIAGLADPDEGTITMAKGTVIGYLPQTPSFGEEDTVLSYVMQDVAKDEAHSMIEAQAKTMLHTLGMDDFSDQVSHMSGGQRKKIALVRTLLSEADLLILDEPTNHLDQDMAQWLEEYLKECRRTIIMVTHDRYFLDAVTDRIVEIEHGSIYSYKTNYSGYLQRKAERMQMEAATEEKRQNFLRNEIKWIMRGAQARSTKQKARLERYEEIKNRKKPEQTSSIQMQSITTRLGKTTVELENVTKQYGDRVLFRNFSYNFLKNDRIGFIGPNGCGKTTMMKMILGLTAPDEGTITVGQTVKIGYYAQEISASKSDGLDYMDPKLRVIDYIKNTAEYVQTENKTVSASVMLDRFLFPPKEQYALIEKLSGGERRRLNLLRVLMEAPNVLILDEPTNDLDIQTLMILEDYLDHFDGIVIVVSHDRYFLDRVVRRIFAFEEGGTLRQYEGGYTDYAIVREYEGQISGGYSSRQKTPEAVSEPERTPKPETTRGENGKRHEQKLRFTYQEQKDFETIEDEIGTLEEQCAAMEQEILKNATDFAKLNELTKQKEALEQLLEQKMERWEYLTERYEQIQKAESAKASL